MSFPETQILPRGSRLQLLVDYQLSGINGNNVGTIRAGTVLTVYTDSGGGRLNVFVPECLLSEIVYLSEHQAKIVN